MVANLPLSLLSNTTQRILTQSNNIAYGTRGVVRVNSVQKERKLDYFFRDFYMVIATAYLGEMGFRAVDTLYNIPLMTKALKLNKLSNLKYTVDGALKYPGANNYTRLPDIVRARLMGSLVKPDSISMVPGLLDKMAKESGVKLTEEEKNQLTILLDHLHKNLNFREYARSTFVDTGKLQATQLEAIIKHANAVGGLEDAAEHELPNLINRVFKAPLDGQTGIKFVRKAKPPRVELLKRELDELREHFAYASPGEKSLFDKLAADMEKSVGVQKLSEQEANALHGQVEALCKKVLESRKPHLEQVWKGVLNDLGKSVGVKKTEFLKIAEDAMTSKTTLEALKRIQRSGTWPKMFSSVILNFVFYGMLANFFDVKILQPWQKKMVAQRGGSSQEFIKPGYVSMLTGLPILVLGMSKWAPAFVKRMSYFTRFAVVGGLGLTAYTATMVAWIKHIAKKPPKTPAGKPQTTPSLPTPAASRPSAQATSVSRPATLPESRPVQQPEIPPQLTPLPELPRPAQQAAPNAFQLPQQPLQPMPQYQPMPGYPQPPYYPQQPAFYPMPYQSQPAQTWVWTPQGFLPAGVNPNARPY